MYYHRLHLHSMGCSIRCERQQQAIVSQAKNEVVGPGEGQWDAEESIGREHRPRSLREGDGKVGNERHKRRLVVAWNFFHFISLWRFAVVRILSILFAHTYIQLLCVFINFYLINRWHVNYVSDYGIGAELRRSYDSAAATGVWQYVEHADSLLFWWCFWVTISVGQAFVGA